jgi:hypothetical protein
MSLRKEKTANGYKTGGGFFQAKLYAESVVGSMVRRYGTA